MRANALPLLALLVGCESAPGGDERPIPFRVALAPITEVEVESTSDEEGPAFDVGPEWVADLEQAIERSLSGGTFVSTTRLAPGATPRPDRRAWLQQASQETDADLLVLFRLRRGTVFRGELNQIITAAAPFCWIPGPHLWPVSDQRYLADCTLTVEVHDLARFRALDERGRWAQRAWYFSDAVTLENLYVDWFERAGWDLHMYLPTILIPTLLIPYERDGLAEALEERAIQKLSEALSYDLQRRRVDLIRNEHEYSFFLDDEHTSVEVVSESEAEVSLRLVHRLGESRNEPENFVIGADDLPGAAVRRDLTWSERAAAYLPLQGSPDFAHFEFRQRVPVTPDTRYLQLSVSAGRSQDSTREFSLALPRASEPE